MVESIKFTGEGKNDYLLKRNIQQELKRGKTIEQYLEEKSSIKSYRRRFELEDKYFKDVDKGLLNELANKCLVGREIKFDRNKINVIFGPNSSGKTTILKTIASYCLCGNSTHFDGFTSIEKINPMDYPYNIGCDREYTQQMINDIIATKAGNHAILKWDGSPVYYQNFANRVISSFSDYEGSILGNLGNSLNFTLNKGKISDGNKSLYLFGQLIDNVVNKHYSFNDIINEYNRIVKTCNDTWEGCFKNTYEYLSKFQNNNNDHITILLDEIDKSLDLNNTALIFSELIPALHNINNDQIIVISHSPLVLSEDICPTSKYNIISMDDNYTETVKKLFRSIKF